MLVHLSKILQAGVSSVALIDNDTFCLRSPLPHTMVLIQISHVLSAAGIPCNITPDGIAIEQDYYVTEDVVSSEKFNLTKR
jgi:hypothetical protein